MKFFMILMGFVLSLSGAASAQVQLPQFSLSNIPTIELNVEGVQDYETAFARISNPLMRDTLRLQYQINLLERLIRRQTEIQRIAESYESIGLPFKQPAPPETACALLPINVLCMAFYPDIPLYKDLISERQEEFKRDQARKMDLMMQDLAAGIAPTDMGGMEDFVPPVVKMSPDRRYIWADIRCLAGNCSALLINRDDSTIRFRIRDGEDLPDDGGKITAIKMTGVDAHYEGKTYALLPEAIGQAQQVDPRPDTSNIANILTQNLGGEATQSPALQDVMNGGDAAIPPQTITTGTPDALLGVTGLF